MNSDIEIARQADIRPIVDIASNLGIPEEYVETYGKHKACLLYTSDAADE